MRVARDGTLLLSWRDLKIDDLPPGDIARAAHEIIERGLDAFHNVSRIAGAYAMAAGYDVRFSVTGLQLSVPRHRTYLPARLPASLPAVIALERALAHLQNQAGD